jgi:hypothetical protein
MKIRALWLQVTFHELDFKIPKGFSKMDKNKCPFSKTKSLFEFDNFHLIYIIHFLT